MVREDADREVIFLTSDIYLDLSAIVAKVSPIVAEEIMKSLEPLPDDYAFLFCEK